MQQERLLWYYKDFVGLKHLYLFFPALERFNVNSVSEPAFC